MRDALFFHKKTTELANNGQIVLNQLGRVEIWNPWMEQASDILKEEAVGRNLIALFGQSLPPRLVKAVDQAIKAGHSSMLSSSFTPHPFPLKHPYDASLKMTQKVVIRSFSGPRGGHYCLIDIADVSLADHREHKLKEQSDFLAKTLSKLENILDGVSEAILSTDSVGRIEALNAAAEQLFGLSQQEALGVPLIDLAPRLPKPFPGKIQQLEVEGSYGKLGSERQGVLRITVTNKQKNSSPTWVISDITNAAHHKRALLEAKQLAEAAARQKSDFLANMSHEIRTPMNGVLGMAELLMDTNLDEEQRDFLATIQNSGEVLLNIINDILDFSKIDSGKTDLIYRPYNLRDVIEDVVGLLSKNAHEKDLEIAYFISHDTPLVVRGDPYRLRQVLLNLIGNAIKFTRAGHVIVKAVLAQGPTACRYHFSVEDTGIGIDETDHDKLFNPFSQADSSTTRKFGGTGLGLAISKRLCLLMNGEIDFESRKGEGSVFSFVLPLDLENDQEQAQPTFAMPDLKVVVISDLPVNRRFVSHQLAFWQIEATHLSFAQTPTHFEKGACDYDLIFLDVTPDMEDHSWITRFFDAYARPIVYLYAQDEWVRRRGQKIPETRTHLAKPLRLSDLGAVLERGGGFSSRKASRPRGSVPEPISLDGRAPRILLVEDNAINRKVICKMLEKMGCQTSTSNNGQEALLTLMGKQYDIILMDCQMPVMDGYQATRQIRESEGESHMPILAMTAHALRGDRDKCLAVGMDDYMSKPVKPDQLYNIIKKWLPGETVEDGSAGAQHTEYEV